MGVMDEVPLPQSEPVRVANSFSCLAPVADSDDDELGIWDESSTTVEADESETRQNLTCSAINNNIEDDDDIPAEAKGPRTPDSVPGSPVMAVRNKIPSNTPSAAVIPPESGLPWSAQEPNGIILPESSGLKPAKQPYRPPQARISSMLPGRSLSLSRSSIQQQQQQYKSPVVHLPSQATAQDSTIPRNVATPRHSPGRHSNPADLFMGALSPGSSLSATQKIRASSTTVSTTVAEDSVSPPASLERKLFGSGRRRLPSSISWASLNSLSSEDFDNKLGRAKSNGNSPDNGAPRDHAHPAADETAPLSTAKGNEPMPLPMPSQQQETTSSPGSTLHLSLLQSFDQNANEVSNGLILSDSSISKHPFNRAELDQHTSYGLGNVSEMKQQQPTSDPGPELQSQQGSDVSLLDDGHMQDPIAVLKKADVSSTAAAAAAADSCQDDQAVRHPSLESASSGAGLDSPADDDYVAAKQPRPQGTVTVVWQRLAPKAFFAQKLLPSSETFCGSTPISCLVDILSSNIGIDLRGAVLLSGVAAPAHPCKSGGKATLPVRHVAFDADAPLSTLLSPGQETLEIDVVAVAAAGPGGASSEPASWDTRLARFAEVSARTLQKVAALAQPEPWGDDMEILRRYLAAAFAKAEEQGKLAANDEGWCVFNSGLQTPLGEDIFCFLSQDDHAQQGWRMRTISAASAARDWACPLPALPDFVSDLSRVERMLDPDLPLYIHIASLLDQPANCQALEELGLPPAFHHVALSGAVLRLREQLAEDPSAAIRGFHGGSSQFLLPLCFSSPHTQFQERLQLALVVDPQQPKGDICSPYYLACGIITLKAAQSSVRVLKKNPSSCSWITPPASAGVGHASSGPHASEISSNLSNITISTSGDNLPDGEPKRDWLKRRGW